MRIRNLFGTLDPGTEMEKFGASTYKTDRSLCGYLEPDLLVWAAKLVHRLAEWIAALARARRNRRRHELGARFHRQARVPLFHILVLVQLLFVVVLQAGGGGGVPSTPLLLLVVEGVGVGAVTAWRRRGILKGIVSRGE